MNITEKLKTLGVEITPEIEKALGGEYISMQEHEKKLSRVESERDEMSKRASSAEETLKGFEGKDFDQLTKDLEGWKAKAEQAEKDFAEQISKRDYMDAIGKLTGELKFTSSSAKKAFMAELEARPLQMRDGKVLGFEDFVSGYKESDADAFVTEERETRSQFTGSISSTNGQNTSSISAVRAAMGLKTDK